MQEELSRYSRQILFEDIGLEGQRRLRSSRVAIIGCGALGSVSADLATRAGIGLVRIVDRDYIEMNNLQRQILFDEEDVKNGLPKAIAARNKLEKINSEVQIEALVSDVNYTNVERLISDVDLVLDGTDNFETRFLLNDACVKVGKPWVYGACVGSYGLCFAIIPAQTPCLRCIFEEAPPPGISPTCDTAGVLSSIVHIIAAMQVTETLKILTGNSENLNKYLLMIDVWEGKYQALRVLWDKASGNCPACGQRHFEFLEAKKASHTTSLCGRNAIQVSPVNSQHLNFEILARRLNEVGEVNYNEFLLRLCVDSYELTVFRDGRAIIKGTQDVSVARGLYAKYIGT